MTDYDYLIALDFEATCDNDANGNPKNPDPQEIIEFPIVAVDVKHPNKQITVLHHDYVRPTAHPVLSEFCKDLTKIKQETVDNADTFPKVFADVQHALMSKMEGKTFTFVTFGHWDLNVALPAQLKALGMEIPSTSPYRSWINIGTAYKDFLGTEKKPKSIPDMCTALELKFEGQLHNGLDDAMGIAKAVRELLIRGWVPVNNGSRPLAVEESAAVPVTQIGAFLLAAQPEQQPPVSAVIDATFQEEHTEAHWVPLAALVEQHPRAEAVAIGAVSPEVLTAARYGQKS